MATEFEYKVNGSGGEWINKIEISDMDQEKKHLFLNISSGRGMSYFLILNIYQNQIILTIPFHDLGIFISPLNDPEYLFVKLTEHNINPIDANNIVWGLNKVWQEFFTTNEE
jgi:hypothetical protein